MLRVYLDQNKWVDLARAATGHPRGAEFVEALTMARAAVSAGQVSFPLDMYRYWETAKRGDDRSRNDVAGLMLELSRHHAMATPFGILDMEIDQALQRRFGRPVEPRQRQVFGIGMRHISDGNISWPGLDLSFLPDGGASVPGGLRVQMNRAVEGFVEDQVLRAGPATFRASGFDLAADDHGARFVEWEILVAAKIREVGLKGDHIDMAVRAADLGDIRSAVENALGRIGMSWESFLDGLGPTGMFEFIDDLPTREVTNIMRSARHRQSEQRWLPNDFVDILALPVAAVHCDVVVTEKQWVHRLRAGKVGDRYGTRLLSNTGDLVEVLVDASLN